MTHTLQVVCTSPSGQVPATLTATGNSNVEENLTIGAAANNEEHDVTLLSASLQSLFLLASAAMTVVCKAGTGGSGTTEATFTLVAGVPQFWVAGNGANPLGGNVGQLLVTSTAGGSLQVRALMT
jgi:hypothetical protein